MTAHAAGPLTVAELASRVKVEELPLAWALVDSGLLATEAPAARSAEASAAHEAAADEADRGKRFTPEEARARATIFGERARAQGLNQYELFGVSPKAPVEEVRRAYLELARRYHSDSYAGLDLGSAAPALAQLFQRVNEAMETLGDPHRRAEYDIYLERSAAGLPTDVVAILEAERLFQRGQALLRGNRPAEALELFQEAVRLNGAEAEFHAYVGYALFRVQGPAAASEARTHLAHALELSERVASAYLLGGLVSRDLGELADAQVQLEKALQIEPKNEEATRELRHLRQRREKNVSGRSLFGRLFKR